MIYFLTVNYYSYELVKNLIESIAKSIGSPHRILIVNNSPEDTKIKGLESDQVSIIEAGENVGFGRGCNLGLSYVWQHQRDALVWLINPDATVDAHADRYVCACFSEQLDISILGTQIRSSDGDIWFQSGYFNRWTGALGHSSIADKDFRAEWKTSPCQWVTGCSLIVNFANFQTCPAFDSNYFLYSEDADFCLRYGKEGHKVAVTHEVLVTHTVSSIIGRNKAFMYEHYTFSRLYFLKQHASIFGLLLYALYSFGYSSILLLKDRQNALGRWRGIARFSKTLGA
jgi:GT2 family glycosyltransferase